MSGAASKTAIRAAEAFLPKGSLTQPRFNLLREIAIGTILGISAGMVWKVRQRLGVAVGVVWRGRLRRAVPARRCARGVAHAAAPRYRLAGVRCDCRLGTTQSMRSTAALQTSSPRSGFSQATFCSPLSLDVPLE